VLAKASAVRFLLVNVPVRLRCPPSTFPIGVASVATALSQAGHDVEVIDANAHRYPVSKVVELAHEVAPEAVGISGLISTYGYQLELVTALKARLGPHVPIVCGGSCASSVPELMAQHCPVDVLALGEGEATAVELAEALSGRRALEQVGGLALCERDVAGVATEVALRRTTPRALETDLDRFGMPAHQLFPLEVYLEHGKVWGFERAFTLVSSRGCPMDCHFCYSIFGRRSYRRRSAEAILEEVRFVKRRYGAQFFAFVDDNLTINKRHLFAVCEGLAREGVAWGCHGRVDTADDERLAAMAESGCKWLGFGIESGSQRMLDAMNKRVCVDQAREAVGRTRAHGIFPNMTFIIGYPGEDEQSVFETMRFMADAQFAAHPFFATPYPGTPLYEQAKGRGLIGDEHRFVQRLDDAGDFVVNLTELSDERLFALRRAVVKEVSLAVGVRNESVSALDEQTFDAVVEELLAGEYLWPGVKAAILRVAAKRLASRGDRRAAAEAVRVAAAFERPRPSRPHELLVDTDRTSPQGARLL
jgi:anaerobic magnesium-protoporphyrin IX monomethyl ester cyclase